MGSMEKYTNFQPIGQGQYGVVYKAFNRLDGQAYCIKKIPMTAKDDHAGALKEVQLLSQLDHPNIIAYKESFVDRAHGGLCIVMGFCEEGDLFHRIRSRAKAKQYFSENEVMDMFCQIASALMHIHSKRILHRDLKTQNIFIARGGIIKLGDFGISKVLEKTDQFATTVTGTPYYMAPEICTNQPYTFKSDIWSLGCVLYELCTLKHAFAADSLLSLVFQIVRGNFPPISTTDYSRSLSGLVNMLLNRDASQRPSLAQVFQMPYVSDHLSRYHAEFKKQLMKQSSTMVKRKQMLEQGLLDENEDTTHMTPKERLKRNKELQIQKHDMELRLATMDTQGDRRKAAERKAHMVHNSNVGLPGPPPTPPRTADASKRVTTPSRADERSQLSGGEQTQGRTMSGSFVNMDTMPEGGYTHMGDTMPATVAASIRQQQQQERTQSPSLFETRENRPLKPPGSAGSQYGNGLGATRRKPGWPALDENGVQGGDDGDNDDDGDHALDGDSVLMGTMGPMGGTMVNMATMGTQSSYGPASGMPAPLPLTPTQVSQQSVRDALSVPQPPMPPPGHAVRPQGRQPSPPSRGHTATSYYRKADSRASHSPSQYSSDYEEDADESPYESDFEDFDDQEIINEKCKLLSNIEDLERTRANTAFTEAPVSQITEHVRISTKTNKAAALRERCQQALGRMFPEVYAYLRKMRTTDMDESQIQRALQQLVGRDPELLKGCFLVDQLVFQETCHQL